MAYQFMNSAILTHSVTIESVTVTRDASGGNSEAWATLESSVPCLIGQTTGRRDQRHQSDSNVWTGTVTGISSNLAKPTVRFLVVTGPRAGRRLRVTGVRTEGGTDFAEKFYVATVEDQHSS